MKYLVALHEHALHVPRVCPALLDDLDGVVDQEVDDRKRPAEERRIQGVHCRVWRWGSGCSVFAFLRGANVLL